MDFPQHFGAYGAGNYIRAFPPQAVLDFSDFSGGYFAATNRESVPDNCTPFAEDVEVTRANRLRRAPGTTLVETFEDRSPDWMFLHGSLDFTAELIFFDAPFMGVQRTGTTVWADKSLQNRIFAATNFGGTFIFSDGRKVYARQSNDGTTITEIEDAPVAQAYASWAGRVWAGMAVIDGNLESLGLVHSASDSDYRNWTGLGAGFELLIDEISAGDRIVALKPMGLDFMAVLLRNSIWVGSRTGDSEVPGDFRPRVPGTGAVTAECCQSTQFGVVYLSDNGVEQFDGNTSTHVSLQIDADLLPLNYSQIRKYRSTYNPVTKRYYLHTPSGPTWIYEVENKRWFRRTLTSLGSVILPVQVPFVTWATVTGDWSAQDEKEWMDYGGISEGRADVIFLGDEVSESFSGRAIAKEDYASETMFGEPMTPKWNLKPGRDEKLNTLLTTKAFLFEYLGSAAIELWGHDNQGVYELLVADTLPARDPSDEVLIPASKTGRLAGLQLRLITGEIELSHIQLQYQKRGPRIEAGIGGVIGPAGGAAYPDRSYNQDFIQGAIAPPTGGWSGRGGPQGPTATAETPTRTGRYKYRHRVTVVLDPAATVASIVWDFGDSTSGSGADVEHTYVAAGTYQVTFTVTDTFDNSFGGHYQMFVPTEAAIDPITLHPVAGAAGGPTDAVYDTTYPGEENGPNTSWANARNLTSGLVAECGESASPLYVGWIHRPYTPPDFFGTYVGESYEIDRSVLRFNAQAMAATPISGRIGLYVGDATAPDTETPDLEIGLYILVLTDSTAKLVAGNFTTITGQAIKASDTVYNMTQLAAAVDSVVEFELNAAGLAHVTTNGFACFHLATADDALGSVPTPPSGLTTADFYENDVYFISADGDPANVPYLTLEFQ